MSQMTSEWSGHSLQRRLLVSMAAGFVLLLLLISILLWTYARAAANRTQDLLLAGAALAILERASVGPDGPTVDLPNSAMEILSLNPVDRVQYRVYSPERGEITGTTDLPIPADISAQPDASFYDADYRGAPFRFVLQTRRLNAPTGPQWIAVQVGQTVEVRTAQHWSFFLSGLAGLGVVSLAGLAFVWLAIRTSLAPLRQIAGDLARRDPGDLSRLEAAPPREIQGLFNAINGFIARLAQSRALTETFIADVAHQTRTSLSALQGHLSLAADAPEFGQMRQRVEKADRQAQRTVRLTNQLLANAMVIHRTDGASLHPLHLKPLVRDTLAEILRERQMRRIALSLDSDELPNGADMVRGDELSIREALRNLIENAVRHGPEDNSIVITLKGTDATVELVVDDAGPGIAEADIGRATERFTSIAAESRGSGLGLSIVKAVADGHDARLSLSRSSLGGLRASIVFPRLVAVLLAALLSLAPGHGAQAETLSIYSATDPPAMRPLIEAFEALHPGVQVDFTEFQTVDLHRDILARARGDMPDVVISSAMDLQVDLVNIGLAQKIALPENVYLPEWATWRSELFGFTFEPAAVVYDRRVFTEEELPGNHRDLATFVRENEGQLYGRIGGYDLRASGIGYLFATQDSLQGPQSQRLMEILGRAGLRTFCCTSEMVEATARGEIVLALNTIGSYAAAMAKEIPQVGLHFFDDYNLVMTRTAFVPAGAARPDLAAEFIAFLLSPAGQEVIAEETPLIPLAPAAAPGSDIAERIAGKQGTFLPIRLNPGLLTYLDKLKQRDFFATWDLSRGSAH